MLKVEVPGGCWLLALTTFFRGQLRDKCPGSLQLKHFPAAHNSSCSFSDSQGVVTGLGHGSIPVWQDVSLLPCNENLPWLIDRMSLDGDILTWWDQLCDHQALWSCLKPWPRPLEFTWCIVSNVTDLTDRSGARFWALEWALKCTVAEFPSLLVCPCVWSWCSATFSEISIILAWLTTSSQVEILGLKLSHHNPFWINRREPFQNFMTLSWSGMSPIILNNSCSSWVYSATDFSFWWHLANTRHICMR